MKSRTERLSKLALRETDPRFYADFEPIERGPVLAVLLAGLLALTLPLYYAGRLWERLRNRSG